MSVCGSLSSVVEESIIDLVLHRGCPVVEDGQENPTLAEHGYAASAWRDSHINSHIKGGYMYDEENRRWVDFNGCGWVMESAKLVGDYVDEKTGKFTLEVEGMICNCGQYSQKTVRHSGKREEILAQMSASLSKMISSKLA